MEKKRRIEITVGAAITALLMGTGMLAIEVYGSDTLADAILEEVQDPGNREEDIFTDGDDFSGKTEGNDVISIEGDSSENTDKNTYTDENLEESGGSNENASGSGYTGVSYTSGSGNSGSSGEKIIRKPQLMLENCNLSGEKLEAGSTCDLEAVFRNKNPKERIYNLKVTLASDSKGLYISRKSFYFKGVEAGSQITVKTSIEIDDGAAEGLTSVTASFEYEDKKGSVYTGTELLDFRVVQPSEVTFECGDLPASAASTDTLLLTLKAQNKSRVPVRNVRIALTGKGLFPKEEIFIGNMESGTQEEGVMRVYIGTRTMKTLGKDDGTSDAERYGTTKGKLTLSYEDSSGITHKEAHKFKLEITKPKILSLQVEKPKEANSWWFSIFAAAGAGMLAIILLLLSRIRRQKIRLEELQKMS